MRERKWIVLVLVLMLAAAGCSCMCDESKPLTQADIAGHVLLESYEIDLTWGYKLSGMYIVGDGTVWSYDYQGSPWYPETLKSGRVSPRDLLSKHKNAKQIGTVDRAGLLDIAQMIRPAAEGRIVRASGSGIASGRLDVAYEYDESSSSPYYREIVLAGSGDRSASNSSSAAAMLVNYLHGVQESVGWTWD